METIYSTTILDLQMDIIQVTITSLLLFAAGIWLGGMKGRKLLKKMHRMEKEIMDLNSELLYNERPSNKMMKTTSAN
jgi:hypothetical protein